MFKLHASCLPSLGWCCIVYFSAASSVFRLWFSVGYICSCSALPYHTCLFGRFPAVTRVKMIGKEGSLTFKEVNLRDSTFSVPMVPPIYLLFFLPFPLFFIQCFFFFIKVICIHCRNPEKYKKLWGGKKKKSHVIPLPRDNHCWESFCVVVYLLVLCVCEFTPEWQFDKHFFREQYCKFFTLLKLLLHHFWWLCCVPSYKYM